MCRGYVAYWHLAHVAPCPPDVRFRGHAAVRESFNFGAVVGGENNDGVVGLTHVFDLLEHEADIVDGDPGTVKTDIFASLDWLPTFVEIAGGAKGK